MDLPSELQQALARVAADPEWQGKIILLPVASRVPAVSEDDLTGEEKKFAREQFLKKENCIHCGGLHLRACRRVKRLVMKNKEDLAEVEFWPDGTWDESGITWPEDVHDRMEDGNGEEAGEDGKAQEAG